MNVSATVQSIRPAFRFFMKHGGGIVGETAACALSMARAEKEAEQKALRFEWEYDDSPDGPREWGWPQADVKRWDLSDHECLSCVCLDERGNVLAALGGIWDADNAYRRVVEAELASEALSAMASDPTITYS